jgi:hypothetical protein
MSKTASPNFYKLAEGLLGDRSERPPGKADIRDLAETIQQAIELWFCANEAQLERRGKNTGEKTPARTAPEYQDLRESL